MANSEQQKEAPGELEYIEFGNTGIKLAIDASVSQKMRNYVVKGWYESHEVQQVQKIVENDDIVLELGSGLGLISTIAWKTGKPKAVHCYEADPRLVPLIRSTHQANGVENATVYNKVLTSDKTFISQGSMDFHIRGDFWGNSINSAVGMSIQKTVKVPVASLAAIIQDIRPTLIIADIEGAEDGLFAGVDLGPVNRIALEVHQPVLGPEGMRRLFDDIHQAGFHYDARYSAATVPVFSRIPQELIKKPKLDFDLSRFVSIGDNCEFAFYQKAHNHEESSLLRWSYVEPEMLLSAMKSDFSGLFRFENLTPYASTMVKDSKYGICFHSKMKSKDKVFIDDEATRRAFHKEEHKKHIYLAEKLREQMEEGRVFVYKRAGEYQDKYAKAIGAEIEKRGPGILLMVYDQGPQAPGHVRHIGKNVFAARIDATAPLSKADAFSESGWSEVLRNAQAVLDRSDTSGTLVKTNLLSRVLSSIRR